MRVLSTAILLIAALLLGAALWLHTALGSPGAPARAASSPAVSAGAPPVATPPSYWTARASYPISLTHPALAYLGGVLYSFGGTVNYPHAVANAYRYDPATDAWTPLSPLPAARVFASAVSDGQYLYILNGEDASGQPQSTLYRYDPRTDSYSMLNPAPVATGAQAAVYLAGKIYRIGGSTGDLTATVDVYDVAGGTWAAGPSLPAATSTWAAAGNGAIYIEQEHKAYRLLPAQNTWDDTAVPDLPDYADGPTAFVNGRWAILGASLAGGFALDVSQLNAAWSTLPLLPDGLAVSAAALGSDLFVVASSGNYVYTVCDGDLLPGGWTVRASYPIPVGGPALASLGDYLYSFTGNSATVPNTAAYRYDPLADNWTQLASLPTARTSASAVSDGTYVYVLNGQPSGAFTPILYRYDPRTNQYATLAPPPVATREQTAVYLNGKIYRIAGNGPSGSPVPSVDVYTIATNTWAPTGTIANYPLAVANPAALAQGGYLYMAGGFYQGPPTDKTYRYDPVQNQWDDGAVRDLPDPRAADGSGLLNGQWILAGGRDGNPYTTSAISLDLSNPANAWSSLPVPPYAPSGLTGTSLGTGFYLLGSTDYGLDATLQRYESSYTCPPIPPSPTPTAIPSATSTPATTPVPTACPLQYADVHPTDYFYQPVEYLACAGVISGYADGTFRPYANTTRSQMVKIVVLGFALPAYTPPTGAYTFADVQPMFPFFAVIESAAHANVVSGYACGGPGEPCDAQRRPYFRPYANVTRGQLSKIDVVAAGWPLRTPGTPAFADVGPGSAFYAFVETAVCRGVISGYADHTFRPGANATRGQIAKIVYLSITAGGACAP